MMSCRSLRVYALSALLLLAAACGSSVVEPSLEGGRIDTVLGAAIIDVGATTDVQCLVWDKDGAAVDTSKVLTLVTVADEAIASLADHTLTAKALGKTAVTCATANGQLTDDTPAELTVSKGGIRDAQTVLKDATVRAGDTVSVQCVLLDEEGQAVEGGTSVTTDPTEGVSIEGADVTFTIVGVYDVACVSSETGIADATPAHITVIPADPATITATPSVSEAKAGDPVVIACAVADPYGNNISQYDTLVDPQEGLVVQGHTVLGQKAGEYDVTCSVDGWDGEVQKIPGPLTILGGEPASVELVPKPARTVYAVNSTVELTAVVRDEFGNELEGIGATFGMPTDPAVEIKSDTKFVFKGEGAFPFTVALVEPYQAITDDAVLTCDETGPAIVDLYPPRGETITGDPIMLVHGHVIDGVSKVVTLVVNDTDVPVDADGYFEIGLPSKHGGNHLVLTAKDEFNHETMTTRGWYYSTGWQPADAPMDEAAITEGAMVYLGQTALDDGDHDPSHLDDIATLFEVLLGGLDLQQLLGMIGDLSFPVPNIVNLNLSPVQGTTLGIFGDLTIDIDITTVTIGKPSIAIDTRDGGIAMSGGFAPVRFDFSLNLRLDLWAEASGLGIDWQSTPWSPSVTTMSGFGAALIALSTDFDIEKLPNEDMTVDAKNFHLELQGVDIDLIEGLILDFGELDIPVIGLVDLGTYDVSQFIGNINDFIGDNLVNPLINLVTQPLIDLLEPLVETVLGPALEQIVNLLVLDLPIDIPPILPGQVDPVSLQLHTELDTVLFTEAGGHVGLNLGVQSTTKAVDRDPLGSILRDGCAGADPEPLVFEFEPAPEVQLGAKYDLVNQALFAIWWGGMLNLDVPLGDLLGGGGGGGSIPIDLSGATLKTNFLLPPILNDCGNKGLTEIHVADAYLDITLKIAAKTHHIGVWLQARAVGGVFGQGNEIGIKIDAIQAFEAEIIDITGQLGPLLNIVQGFIPQLLDMVAGQQFAFPIPGIDLSIIPGVPQGTMLNLGNFNSYNKKGAFVVGGDLL